MLDTVLVSALLWAVAADGPDAQEALRLGEPVAFELHEDEREAGTYSRSFECESDFAGTLFLWVESQDFDPLLVVRDEDRDKEDVNDEVGAGTIAVLLVEVERGTQLRVRVRSSDDKPGSGVLHGTRSPDSEETRAAARKAFEHVAQMQGLIAEGKLREASDLATKTFEDLCSVPGGGQSMRVNNALVKVATQAYRTRNYVLDVEIQERVLAFRSSVYPADHPQVQAAKNNLAVGLKRMGDIESALALQQEILAVRERCLSNEHPKLLSTRNNLANLLRRSGRIRESKEMLAAVLEVQLRTLDEKDPQRLRTQSNLAIALKELGHVREALALELQVLEIDEQRFPDDHLDLQDSRGNVGNTLRVLGNLGAARELHEHIVEVLSEKLPEDHTDLLRAQNNFAAILKDLGDLDGSRALHERILRVRSQRLPDDHRDVLMSRQNLGGILIELGETEKALELFENVYASHLQRLPADSSRLNGARLNLAEALRRSGELPRARELQQDSVAALERGSNRLLLESARFNLSITLKDMGDIGAGRALQESVLTARASLLPCDHPDLLRTKQSLAWTRASDGDRSAAIEMAAELASDVREAVQLAARSQPMREAEAVVLSLSAELDCVLSLAVGAGLDEPSEALIEEGFASVETLRGASLIAAPLLHMSSSSPVLSGMRAELREASARVSRLAMTSSETGQLREAILARDRIQRDLLVFVNDDEAASALSVQPERASLASLLAEDEALVGYWVYGNIELDPERPNESDVTVQLIAHVLVATGELTRLSLGPLEEVRRSVDAWRSAIQAPVDRGIGVQAEDGLQAAGSALRHLVWDPVAAHLEGVTRVTVAAADALHLVPLDALPLEDGVLGDELRIQMRPTLWELLIPSREPRAEANQLLALGGIDFDTAPAAVELLAMRGRATERSAVWDQGFGPLVETTAEVRGIAALHTRAFGDERKRVVLEGGQASKSALVSEAPATRFLHIATHGYFAPNSVPSTHDMNPADAGSGLGGPLVSKLERVRGMSPLVLCGLALAGANLPPDELGSVQGVITAEEIAALDLFGCELGVLSACDTSVGVQRSSLGIASLQKALHAAGVRSVITSLWKVRDEATRELMVDFYRRLWREDKPKHQALWEAKMRLRDKRDEQGRPVYGPRDWSGWVLTGDPD